MLSSWSLFARSSEPSAKLETSTLSGVDHPHPAHRETSASGHPHQPGLQLEGLGQRNELLQVRLSQMADRLEDLKSLGEDFSQLVSPLEAIVVELPRSQARVQEMEALLSRELSVGQDLRREVDSLASQLAAGQGEISNLTTLSRKLETRVQEADSAAEERTLVLREKTLLLRNLQSQLSQEAGSRERLEAELAMKRAENEANEQSLRRIETAFERESEQRLIHEAEGRRLQSVVAEQAERQGLLEARNAEILQQRDSQLQSIALLESKIMGDAALAEKTAQDTDAALAQLTSERSALALKLDATSSRQATTDQILGGIRIQLREKDEAFRASERLLKDAVIERAAVERRIEGLREEVQHHVLHIAQSEERLRELDDRCDMLSKGLSAKDAALENAATRIGSLTGRLEGLTKRNENDRLSLEAANRRLIEELESEKAERTLAQGALEIARENRMALQRQNEVLKRAARANQGRYNENDVSVQTSPDRDMDGSNVSFLTLQDRSSDQ